MMEAILGPLPPRFIRDTRKSKYFWHNQLDWDPDSPDGRYVREHCRKLKVIDQYEKERERERSEFIFFVVCKGGSVLQKKKKKKNGYSCTSFFAASIALSSCVIVSY